MQKITYVTSNYGKYLGAKSKFESKGLELSHYSCELNESFVNDISYISKQKAYEAYNKVGSPIFVSDTGFYIEAYPNNPNYPGAFAKRSGIATNIDFLLETMKNVVNRNCHFLECITFYDGENIKQFYGSSYGKLSEEKRGNVNNKAWSNLWLVFIPGNYDKTLAEMSDVERKKRSESRISATDKFINWYINEYTNKNDLKKKNLLLSVLKKEL